MPAGFESEDKAMREYVELNCLEEDGRLYHNNLLDTIEALIPNQFDSVHAADLLELPDGDLLACWFAGSDEGNADQIKGRREQMECGGDRLG